MIGPWRRALIATMCLLPVAAVVAGGVKVRVEHDKTFNFEGLENWAWHPDGTGEVKMLMSGSAARDPDDLQARVDPTIVQAVEDSLRKRGLAKGEPGKVPLQLHYYLLVGAGQSMQQAGQFLPATTSWGLPPMLASTSSHEVYVKGSLVLDISTPGENGITVWRGIAEAEVDGKFTEAQRRERIAGAIAKMLEKFPPKYKKQK